MLNKRILRNEIFITENIWLTLCFFFLIVLFNLLEICLMFLNWSTRHEWYFNKTCDKQVKDYLIKNAICPVSSKFLSNFYRNYHCTNQHPRNNKKKKEFYLFFSHKVGVLSLSLLLNLKFFIYQYMYITTSINDKYLHLNIFEKINILYSSTSFTLGYLHKFNFPRIIITSPVINNHST